MRGLFFEGTMDDSKHVNILYGLGNGRQKNGPPGGFEEVSMSRHESRQEPISHETGS